MSGLGAHADPRVERAIADLKQSIRAEWPTAEFAISRGDDPEGIYLDAEVDVDDTDVVMDVVVDRLLQLQIEEQLPIYLVVTRTPRRIAEALRLAGERPWHGAQALLGS